MAIPFCISCEEYDNTLCASCEFPYVLEDQKCIESSQCTDCEESEIFELQNMCLDLVHKCVSCDEEENYKCVECEEGNNLEDQMCIIEDELDIKRN